MDSAYATHATHATHPSFAPSFVVIAPSHEDPFSDPRCSVLRASKSRSPCLVAPFSVNPHADAFQG